MVGHFVESFVVVVPWRRGSEITNATTTKDNPCRRMCRPSLCVTPLCFFFGVFWFVHYHDQQQQQQIGRHERGFCQKDGRDSRRQKPTSKKARQQQQQKECCRLPLQLLGVKTEMPVRQPLVIFSSQAVRFVHHHHQDHDTVCCLGVYIIQQ